MARTLTEDDRAKIAQAVAEAETLTSVELRLVLVHASSHYTAFALFYPAFLALLAGGITAALRPAMHAQMLFTGEALLFLAGLVAMQWMPLRLLLVPPAVKRTAAWQFARVHYADIGLRQPHIGSALLIFCSAAERRVEILADDVIGEKLPSETWQPVADAFKVDLANGRTALAFIGAVAVAAEILAPVFPPKPGQTSQIPDDLVEP